MVVHCVYWASFSSSTSYKKGPYGGKVKNHAIFVNRLEQGTWKLHFHLMVMSRVFKKSRKNTRKLVKLLYNYLKIDLGKNSSKT